MKGSKYLIFFLITLFGFIIEANAASASLSVSSSKVSSGSKFTTTVRVNSAAAWNVHVTSSGPVKGCSINQADASADASNVNKTFSVSCTTTGEGTITIKLTGDVTDANTGNATILSSTKTVTVTKKSTSSSSQNNKSTNNKVKEIAVDGYELVKVNDNNYTLTVANDVTSINLKATAQDTKATVSGTGNHNINVGDNNITVIVTSESGSQNKINIKVTRKDGYTLDELDKLLSNEDEVLDINISNDTILSEDILNKINDSNKLINFNYYDNNKELIYTWIVDGNKLENISQILTTITFSLEEQDEIDKLSNYAKGLVVKSSASYDGIKGISIRLYNDNYFNSENLLNIYEYYSDNKELKLLKESIQINDNTIEFEFISDNELFITNANLDLLNGCGESNKDLCNKNVYYIVIVLLIIVVGLVSYIIFIKRKSVILK